MKLYNPAETDRKVKYDGVDYVLVADAVTELPDAVGAHALKRLASIGVAAIPDAIDDHAEIIARAEATYLTWHRMRAGGTQEHPFVADARAAAEALDARKAARA